MSKKEKRFKKSKAMFYKEMPKGMAYPFRFLWDFPRVFWQVAGSVATLAMVYVISDAIAYGLMPPKDRTEIHRGPSQTVLYGVVDGGLGAKNRLYRILRAPASKTTVPDEYAATEAKK